MSSINITTKQFTEVLVAYLVDNLIDGPAPNTEEWSDFLGVLRSKNIHVDTYKFYMEMDPNSRVLYKNIKKIFHNGSESAVINIRPMGSEAKPKDSIVKTIKKVLKVLKSERQRRGTPLSEERVDRIIDYVVTEYLKENETCTEDES